MRTVRQADGSSRKVTHGDRAGRCFELSAQHVVNRSGATLVHGSIQGFGNPRIDHAWVVESNGQVWEPTMDHEWDPNLFRVFFHAQSKTIYSSHEAAVLMLNSGHYGPWS